MTRPIRHGETRYEYQQTGDFAEVQRLAAEGWRVVAATAVMHPVTAAASALYVLERRR